MNGNITWDMESLQATYDKLSECITQLKEIVDNSEKNSEELKNNWITTKSQAYFEEEAKVRIDALKMISEYENARDQLYKKIQVLRSMDEE